MKKPLILILFLFGSSFTYCQFDFSAEMGPMINFQKGVSGNSNAPFSRYVNLEIKNSKKTKGLTLDLEWNVTNLSLDQVALSSFSNEVFIQANYLKINPNYEFKTFKFLSISIGGYTSFKLNEVAKVNSFFSSSQVIEIGDEVVRVLDFGFTYGGKIHFSKKVALTFNFTRGINHLIRNKIEIDLTNGFIFDNGILENRNFQFGVAFNLSEI